MDPQEGGLRGDGGGGGAEGRPRIRPSPLLVGCCFSLILSLIASFVFSFLAGLVTLAIGQLSSSAAVSVPSTCRILSSSVDLRSSKICEIGMLNYKAKHVFFHSDKSRFRCRYDYYWASVFEVNETYNCSYMPGSKKADIYNANIFNCQAEELSVAEMIRRLKTFYSEKASLSRMIYPAAGFLSGVLASVFTMILIRSLHEWARTLTRKWYTNRHKTPAIRAKLKRVCLLVAYFSIMGWLALKYFEMIGLKQRILVVVGRTS